MQKVKKQIKIDETMKPVDVVKPLIARFFAINGWGRNATARDTRGYFAWHTGFQGYGTSAMLDGRTIGALNPTERAGFDRMHREAQRLSTLRIVPASARCASSRRPRTPTLPPLDADDADPLEGILARLRRGVLHFRWSLADFRVAVLWHLIQRPLFCNTPEIFDGRPAAALNRRERREYALQMAAIDAHGAVEAVDRYIASH